MNALNAVSGTGIAVLYEPDKSECPVCLEAFSGRTVTPVVTACCQGKLCLNCATRLHKGKDIASRTCALCRQNPMPLTRADGIGFTKKSPFYEKPEAAACRKGDLAALEQLLKQKPKIVRERVYSPLLKGKAPLIFTAVESNKPDVVRVLLNAGAKVNAKASYNITPICFAAQHGLTESLEPLLAAGAKVNDASNYRGYSPLHCAAQHNHPDCVHLLLKLDADVNARSKDGCTPLHAALEISMLHL